MFRLFLVIIVAGLSLMTGGCASDAPKSDDTNHVSSIPWNRPEQWEGQGMMGGMLNTH